MEPEFSEPVTHKNTSAEIKDLMDQANEKLKWARDMALEFLNHANELELRANSFRRLAATMVAEAHTFNDEVADLIAAEFPLGPADEE